MGRTASGVRGMKLKGEDFLVSMGKINSKDAKDLQIAVISQRGYGKRSPLSNYKVQNRGGSGIRTHKVSEKSGKVVKAFIVNNNEVKEQDLVIISEKGQVIRLPLKSTPVLNRDTQGVRVMRFKIDTDKVASVAAVGIKKED